MSVGEAPFAALDKVISIYSHHNETEDLWMTKDVIYACGCLTSKGMGPPPCDSAITGASFEDMFATVLRCGANVLWNVRSWAREERKLRE